MASPNTSSAVPAEPRLGLRERKKIQTRRAIRRAAYRLFERQGYDATPVDRIAEAADVSPSTVFRYFPTKDDIVLSDDYAPVMETALRARPADEPPVTAVRRAAATAVRHIVETDLGELRQRTRLIREVPALRSRQAEGMGQSARMLRSVLAERHGLDDNDMELRVVVGAIMAAMHEALMHWVEEGQQEDLVSLIDHALAVLDRGLTL
ncbi:TetR/AcrR family transcriptional regulator [Streptomyces sp. UNOC14_S4]|uniref:TetR/AcrR family transcriptional regulator n=1 Tax=Streptomyces sp. UNOC14_S4 TaxID=2872340 RepID=UPI001E490182|nr:TetR family transcriptional regulator [Streptomyces sp. UNOC14_S4]MCC3770399.1 TetR family transcriptional regulator [Streptomyces sp. UNOC14_S4]